MANNTKDSTTTIKVVCAILFIFFAYKYIYSVQGDLLGMLQYAWSDGKTHYNRTVGAAIIVPSLTLLSFGVMLFTRQLPNRFFALNFFPAMLAMGLMTAVSVSGTTVTMSIGWLIMSVILFVLYIFFINAATQYKPFMIPLRSTSFLSQVWWNNLACFLAMVLLVFCMGNTDRTLHTRLAVERLCQEQKWQEALDLGFPQYDNDSSLTMLRAMALANTSQLGERLFQYDITGKADALMPRRDRSVSFLLGNGYSLWQTIGKVARDTKESPVTFLNREIMRAQQDTLTADTLHRIHRLRPVAHDYLLCAHLLNKDLKAFATTLPQYYTINDSLPQHYKEALLIYNTACNKPDTLIGNAIKADYSDFMKLMRTNRNKTVRHSAIRDNYFGTYWYYYYK